MEADPSFLVPIANYRRGRDLGALNFVGPSMVWCMDARESLASSIVRAGKLKLIGSLIADSSYARLAS